MASFNVDFSALDNLTRTLEDNGLFDDDFQAEMLFAGADIAKKAASDAMRSAGHKDTGETLKHIGYRKEVKITKTGARKVVLTILGKDENGERYAVKAFVLNYGRYKSGQRGHIPASYFWTRAKERANKRVLETWESMVTDKLKEKGLI